MELTVSTARPRLGELVTLAQDPRQVIVLTRHGKRVAALVSMAEVKRIWKLQDDDWIGPRNPVTGKRRNNVVIQPQNLTLGPNGTVITRHAAAEAVREIQMTRAEERRILREGGLDPVEGGEIAERDLPRWVARLMRWVGA